MIPSEQQVATAWKQVADWIEYAAPQRIKKRWHQIVETSDDADEAFKLLCAMTNAERRGTGQ